MKVRSLLFILSLFLLLVSCGEKGNASDQSTKEENTPSDVSEIQEPELIPNQLFVWVDQLNMRKEPTLDSEVLIKLKEGAEVTFLNEKSEEEITANLRGKSFTGPFSKIKTSSGLIGWIFSPALTETNPIAAPVKEEITYDDLGLLIHEQGIGSWLIKKKDHKEQLVNLATAYSLDMSTSSGDNADRKIFSFSRDPLHYIELNATRINKDSITVDHLKISDDICLDQYGVSVGESFSEVKKKRKDIKQNTNSKGETFAYSTASNIMYKMCCAKSSDKKEQYANSDIADWKVTSIYWYPNHLKE